MLHGNTYYMVLKGGRQKKQYFHISPFLMDWNHKFVPWCVCHLNAQYNWRKMSDQTFLETLMRPSISIFCEGVSFCLSYKLNDIKFRSHIYFYWFIPFFQISNSMVAYPIQLQCLTHHNKCQSPSLSFKGVPSTMKYTKEILKNTKEKWGIRIAQFLALNTILYDI